MLQTDVHELIHYAKHRGGIVEPHEPIAQGLTLSDPTRPIVKLQKDTAELEAQAETLRAITGRGNYLATHYSKPSL